MKTMNHLYAHTTSENHSMQTILQITSFCHIQSLLEMKTLILPISITFTNILRITHFFPPAINSQIVLMLQLLLHIYTTNLCWSMLNISCNRCISQENMFVCKNINYILNWNSFDCFLCFFSRLPHIAYMSNKAFPSSIILFSNNLLLIISMWFSMHVNHSFTATLANFSRPKPLYSTSLYL